MNTKALLIFGLAISVGIGAVLLIQDWMNKRSTQVTQKITSTTKVVIAKIPLTFGAVVRAENLDVIDWPTRIVPKGSFRTIKDLVNDQEPRVVLRPVEANEPLLKSKVSGFGGRASLSAVISKKMRGATIRVNDVIGVAGFVLPGDRIDVLLTRDGAGGSKHGQSTNLITDVLLQNIKVLATDQNLNQSKDKPSIAKAVTLEVTAHQAQKLVLAQKVGSLSLALRNGKNAASASTQTVRIADLRVGEVNDKPARAKSKSGGQKKIIKRRGNSLSRIRIVRGTKESEYRVTKERNAATLRPVVATHDDAPMSPDASVDAPIIKKPAPRHSLSQQSPGIMKLPISLIGKRRTIPGIAAP
jgi:pilus assembly protein CpaB